MYADLARCPPLRQTARGWRRCQYLLRRSIHFVNLTQVHLNFLLEGTLMERTVRCRQHVNAALKLVDREQDAMLTYLLEVALLELDERLLRDVRAAKARETDGQS